MIAPGRRIGDESHPMNPMNRISYLVAAPAPSLMAFDFAFLVTEFRTTTPESVNSSSIVVCRGLWKPNSDISKTYSHTYSLDENPLRKRFHCKIIVICECRAIYHRFDALRRPILRVYARSRGQPCRNLPELAKGQ